MTAHQRDLFSKRWRKVEAPDPLEEQIHKSLVAQLRWRCRPGVIWFHVPNGGYRWKTTAATLKALGVRAGVADLQFIWTDATQLLPDPCQPRTYVLFLELKRPGGRQSPEQKQFQTDCGLVLAHYEIADNIDEAIGILESYGLLRRPLGRNQNGPTGQ
jgi:hypothetical protein